MQYEKKLKIGGLRLKGCGERTSDFHKVEREGGARIERPRPDLQSINE
jgi:hypothetical protein